MSEAVGSEAQDVGRPKSPQKLFSVKVRADAYKAVNIASGYTGDMLTDFISDILLREATKVIDEQHKIWEAERKARETGG